jgi:uncharacterized RDD family membrane protein YckC
VDVATRVAWRPDAYAGFWQRVGGYLIDVLLFLLVFAVLAAVLGGGPEATAPNLLASLIYLVYDTVLTARYGATLGKRAAGIEVRRPDGTLPSYGLAFGRYFARILSVLPFGLGYLWPVFDERKQTFHDKVVRTVVVQRRLVEPAEDGTPAATGWSPPPSGAWGAGGGWGQGAGAPQGGGWGQGAGAPQGGGWGQGAGAPQGGGWGQGAGAPQAGGWGTPDAPQGGGWGTPGQADAAPTSEGMAPAGPGAPSGGGWLSGDTMESARWGASATPPGGAESAEGARPEGGGDATRPDGQEQRGAAEAGDAAPGQPADGSATPAGGGWGDLGDQVEALEGAHGVDGPAPEPDADPGSAGTDAAGTGGPGVTDTETSDTGIGGPGGPGGAAGAGAAAAAGPARTSPDPNLVAVQRAGLTTESAAWLEQVAAQVDPRLDRVRPDWRAAPQAEAARACAFGILLGHLVRLHPHMAPDLGRVAEVHPSFSTLLEGSRLATLEQIAAEPARATAWLGPLLDVEERERIAALVE